MAAQIGIHKHQDLSKKIINVEWRFYLMSIFEECTNAVDNLTYAITIIGNAI